MFTMCQTLWDIECQNMSVCPYKDPKEGKGSWNLICIAASTFPWWVPSWVSDLLLLPTMPPVHWPHCATVASPCNCLPYSTPLTQNACLTHLWTPSTWMEYHWEHSGCSVNTLNTFFLFLKTILKFSPDFNSCCTMDRWYETTAMMGGHLHHKARAAGSETWE